MSRTRKITTLIVDDSVFYRQLLSGILTANPAVEVVGSVGTGSLALSKIPQVRPELVTLDVEMPGMNGLELLKEIRALYPDILVVMISSATRSGAEVTIQALSDGALDFIEKPQGGDPEESERLLQRQLRRILSIVETKIILREGARLDAGPGNQVGTAPAAALGHGRVDVLGIGVSTGGPGALPVVLKALPVQFPLPVVIVQHMPPMFVSVLAETLNRYSSLPVVEAEDDMPLQPGRVYLAPGGRQAKVIRSATTGRLVIRLTDDPPENFCRPSVDYMFRSLADVFGAKVLAVIMTGMGRDGVAGLQVLKNRGATVFAQDQASSVVYGMAMEANKAGVVDVTMPLDALGPAIVERIAR